MMTNITPSIEFFVGLAEELSNVSLRRSQSTGVFTVVMIFERLKAIEKFQSFTARTYGDLRLIDEEGTITVTPSSIKFSFGGEDDDELKKAECSFEIEQEEYWDRFMRFMDRYAEANGMEFRKK
jgi:photosystem II Psb28-2 protein